MNTTDVMARLHDLDPEPTRELNVGELRAKSELLNSLMRDPERTQADITSKASPRRRERITVAIVAMAAIVVGAVAVTLLPERQHAVGTYAMGVGALSTEDLATWTSTPRALEDGSPVEEGCTSTLAANPQVSGNPRVLNSDSRGDVASVIVAQGHYTAWCVGTDEIPMFMLLEGPGHIFTKPAADQIVFGPSGGKLPPEGYGFAAGTAGDDVVAVTLHEDGLDIVATVRNGWWSAWWPSEDETATVDGTFTVETADGATATYPAADLRP